MTKVDLQGYKHREWEMRHLEGIIQELRERIESPTAVALTGMPRADSDVPDRMAENVAKLGDLLGRYNAIWDEKIELQHRIEDAIAELEPLEQALIRMRYIDGMNWERICVDLCYSWKQIHRIHRRALASLERGHTMTHSSVI